VWLVQESRPRILHQEEVFQGCAT